MRWRRRRARWLPHNFPAPGRTIQKSNAHPEPIPLHPDEKLVVQGYLKAGKRESNEVIEAYTRLEIRELLECSRLQAAVA
jgi:hypothetical protein